MMGGGGGQHGRGGYRGEGAPTCHIGRSQASRLHEEKYGEVENEQCDICFRLLDEDLAIPNESGRCNTFCQLPDV